jgi:hypothetical protein
MNTLVAMVLSLLLGVAVLPSRSDAARNWLFNGTIRVEYSQAYVTSSGLPETMFNPDDPFEGQSNGLVGAAIPGFLLLTTGLHTGPVRFRAELVNKEPLLDPTWEDVVEVSFQPAGSGVALDQWGGHGVFPLDVPAGSYRVRYSAKRMDLANMVVDSQSDDARPIDSYLLTFWPAPPAPDRIVKVGSLTAAQWHRCTFPCLAEAAPRSAEPVVDLTANAPG